MYQKLDTPYTCTNPILLLSFNRLDTLKRVLHIIDLSAQAKSILQMTAQGTIKYVPMVDRKSVV